MVTLEGKIYVCLTVTICAYCLSPDYLKKLGRGWTRLINYPPVEIWKFKKNIYPIIKSENRSVRYFLFIPINVMVDLLMTNIHQPKVNDRHRGLLQSDGHFLIQPVSHLQHGQAAYPANSTFRCAWPLRSLTYRPLY